MRLNIKATVAIFIFILLVGCATNVTFIPPEPYRHESKIPLNAFFYMDGKLREKMVYWKMGHVKLIVLNIPIGEFAHEYTISYLREGFTFFAESNIPSTKLPNNILIRLTSIGHNYYLAAWRWNFNIKLSFTVENSKGEEIFKKDYLENGSLTHFNKSNALEQIHLVMDKILVRLIDDIHQNHKKWIL